MTDDASVAAFAGHSVHVFAGEAVKYESHDGSRSRHRRSFLASAPALSTISASAKDMTSTLSAQAITFSARRAAKSRIRTGSSAIRMPTSMLHAIADALYPVARCLPEADIGFHFPPSDSTWKGAASDIFLRHAAAGYARAIRN